MNDRARARDLLLRAGFRLVVGRRLDDFGAERRSASRLGLRRRRRQMHADADAHRRAGRRQRQAVIAGRCRGHAIGRPAAFPAAAPARSSRRES